MLSIYRKELNAFFSSLVGYIAVVSFLIITGLFLWVFPGTSILSYGMANLDVFFEIAPWVFLLLIPAVTMRSFAEERSSGTIELLATKPLRDIEIILGKYLAALTLVVFSLLPTFLYYYSVYELGQTRGNLDSGGIMGSYIGLFLLAASFTAIGLFASSVTKNQIVSLLLAVFLCFFFFIAFDFIADLGIFFANADAFIKKLGIADHYASISRGLVDTRDVVYFLTVITLFLLFTRTSLESRKW